MLGKCYYPHVTDEKVKAQFPRTPVMNDAARMGELRFKTGPLLYYPPLCSLNHDRTRTVLNVTVRHDGFLQWTGLKGEGLD